MMLQGCRTADRAEVVESGRFATPNSLKSHQINVPRLNLHSARGTAGAPLPAISCLGAFWTPAATARGRARHAGVQKPAHEETHAPQQTITLFYHLVGAGEHDRRHIEAERLG